MSELTMHLVNPIFSKERVQPKLDSVFVIMPFREKWSDYIYREYISRSVKGCKLNAVRADDMYGRNILSDIWTGIASCRLVIADLSVPNENVFYELGIAHTLGKPTILLTQSAERIPFDLRTHRMVIYSDDHPGYETLKRELPRHLAAVLSEPINEVHHVTSILGGYVIESAEQMVTLHDVESEVATIVDSMEIIGTRPNGVLVNKVVESTGKVSDFNCNHRFVVSDLPDIIKMAALFDPPYMGEGDKRSVIFEYRVTNGFESDKIWRYDCSIDVEKLRFVLTAPAGYKGQVKIVRIIKPSDYDVDTLQPHSDNGKTVYMGTVNDPQVGSTYALRWT
jgi:hypothetical protein